jgi:hypothetical protein
VPEPDLKETTPALHALMVNYEFSFIGDTEVTCSQLLVLFVGGLG